MKKIIASMVVIGASFAQLKYQRIKNNLFHPGYSCCGRCHKTWDAVESHTTCYDDCHWVVTTPKGQNLPIEFVAVPNDGKTHDVIVKKGTCCFPLCEQCWLKLKTPEARLPYYRELVESWKQWDRTPGESEKKWPLIKAAVLS